jgi:cytochrome c biogenesis protein CcdA
MDELTSSRRSLARFSAVAAGLVVIGVAGYIGFVAFVGSEPGVAAGVMVLAAGTGFAAFFSPCSFPLMLTFLARRSTDSPGAALASALRVAGGVALLLAVQAAAVVFGGFAIGGIVEFDSTTGRMFRLFVGLLLVIFGLRQARVLPLRMRWLDRVAGFSARRRVRRSSGLSSYRRQAGSAASIRTASQVLAGPVRDLRTNASSVRV